jgi:hypothetical protein
MRLQVCVVLGMCSGYIMVVSTGGVTCCWGHLGLWQLVIIKFEPIWGFVADYSSVGCYGERFCINCSIFIFVSHEACVASVSFNVLLQTERCHMGTLTRFYCMRSTMGHFMHTSLHAVRYTTTTSIMSMSGLAHLHAACICNVCWNDCALCMH